MSALRLQELRTVTHEASVQPQTGQNRMKSSARIVVDVVVRLQTPGGSAPRATNPNRARLSGLGWQSPVLRLACRTDAQRPSWRPLSVADDAADVEETELTPEGDIESWSALPPAAALPSLASLGRRRRPRAGSAGGHEGATSGLDGETECGDGDDGVAAGLQQVRGPRIAVFMLLHTTASGIQATDHANCRERNRRRCAARCPRLQAARCLLSYNSVVADT